MALVGSISGSAGTNSVIGVTGSVIFSNNPAASFPTDLPGVDVQFFVSGSRGGKNGTTRNVAVFGGDAVVSGSLTVDTGSVVITSNDVQIGSTGHVQFGTSANRIALVGSDLKFFDGSNPGGLTLSTLNSGGGGGGGGDSFFSSTTNGSIFTTGSAIFRGPGTDDSPADLGTDLFFYVSGSSSVGGSRPTSGVSSFGGDLVVTGALYTDGNVSVGGNIIADSEEAKSVFVNVGPNNVTIGSANASAAVIIGNDLQVDGNDIKMNGGTTAITFSGTGDVTVAGDLTVSGGKVTLTNGSIIDSETAGTLKLTEDLIEITGDLKVAGNDIKSSTGATAITLSGANVIIPGDLTVQGTTLTVDATTVEMEDPVIGLGFTSGSIEVSNGDRGFIGGLLTGDNAAFIWDDSESGFATIRTAAGTATGVPVTVSDYAPLRTGKLELGGFAANVYLTSSDGTSVNLNVATASSASLSINGSKRIDFGEFAPSEAQVRGMNGLNLANLWLSGTNVNLGHATGNAVKIFGAGSETGRIQSATGNLFLIARDGGGAGQILNLTGSEVKIGTNGSTGQNVSFQFGHNQTRGLARWDSGNSLFVLGSHAGFGLVLSSSSGNVRATHAEASGLGLYVDASTTPHFDIVKNSTTTTAAGGSGQNVKLGSGLGSTTLTLSGSTVDVTAGASGINFRRDSTTIANISSPSANVLDIAAAATFTTANIVNTVATTVNIGGNATTVEIGASSGTTSINNSLTVDGNVTLGNGTDDDITFTGRAASSLLPKTDSLYNLGSADKRWANIYTGDLHLRNDRGNWTIIEEEEYLSITNNISGKRYKFVLEEL